MKSVIIPNSIFIFYSVRGDASEKTKKEVKKMNWINFVICGIMSFLFTLWISFAISGGITPRRDEFSGIRKFSIEGGVEPVDFARAAIFAGIYAFAVGTARISGGWGLVVFIVMLAVMAYLTWWGIKEVSKAQEALPYAANLILASLIAKAGAAKTSALFGAAHSVLMAIATIALIGTIAAIIVSALFWRSDHEEDEGTANILKYSGIGVIIFASILVLVVIF